MANYQEIDSLEGWGNILTESETMPVFVFKHSTTCPISANAWKEWKSFLARASEKAFKYVVVKVIESRPVSNQVASDLGVKHESPQAILISKRSPIWHASHYDITQSSLEKAWHE